MYASCNIISSNNNRKYSTIYNCTTNHTNGYLLRQWRIAIVGAFFVTAVITPGDVVTAQVIMAVPMTLLYFLSVALSWLVARRRSEAVVVSAREGAPRPQPIDGGDHA